MALNWGETSSDFTLVALQLDDGEPLGFDSFLQHLRRSPALRRWQVELDRRRAQLERESANRLPDITISAGAKRYHDAGEQAYVVGFAVPLPLFDRNQGGIREATRRVEQAEAERVAAEARLIGELSQAYAAYRGAGEELRILNAEALPFAAQAFAASTRGYQLGKFGYLEMLDAQRALFDLRARELRARADYRRHALEVALLAG